NVLRDRHAAVNSSVNAWPCLSSSTTCAFSAQLALWPEARPVIFLDRPPPHADTGPLPSTVRVNVCQQAAHLWVWAIQGLSSSSGGLGVWAGVQPDPAHDTGVANP